MNIATLPTGLQLNSLLYRVKPKEDIAIFNSFIPVVGVITSCLCLGEPFYYNYIVAALLSAYGIYIINKAK